MLMLRVGDDDDDMLLLLQGFCVLLLHACIRVRSRSRVDEALANECVDCTLEPSEHKLLSGGRHWTTQHG